MTEFTGTTVSDLSCSIDQSLFRTGLRLLQEPELSDVLTADDKESVRGPGLYVHPRLTELHLLPEHGEGGEVESNGLDDICLVQIPNLDDSILAVGEHKSLLCVELDVHDSCLVTSQDGGWSGGYHGVPQPDHHVIAPCGQDSDLLFQIKAPNSPGELEDVAVELVSDVHDDDGGMWVSGAGDYSLVVSQIVNTIDTISMHSLVLIGIYDFSIRNLLCFHFINIYRIVLDLSKF